MRDVISVPRIATLHPLIREDYQRAIELTESRLGPYCAIRVVQALRTFSEQNGIYALGRTVKNTDARPGLLMGSTVTGARGGQSEHNYGLAGDNAILYDKDKNGTFESLSWDLLSDLNRDGLSDWATMVRSFKECNFEWGGDWRTRKDNPHFERLYGMHWRQMLIKYQNKDFIAGTDFIKIP